MVFNERDFHTLMKFVPYKEVLFDFIIISFTLKKKKNNKKPSLKPNDLLV